MRCSPRRASSGPIRVLVLTGLVGFLSGCSPAASATEESTAGPAEREVQRGIRDLITAVTPFAPTVSVGERNAWYDRRRKTLERLRVAGLEHGREALRVFHERRDSLPEIRVGLLDIAAHAAPDETRPLLVLLVTTFGENLHLRTKAAQFLGETSPQAALQVIEPMLRGDRPRATHPPEEKLLDAWNTAAGATGEDRAPLLCEIATDVTRPEAVRHLAARLLGEFPSNQGRQALEGILVESSGNSYIRRLAAQSLERTVPAAELCPLLQRVFENEADVNIQIFLDDMIRTTCR